MVAIVCFLQTELGTACSDFNLVFDVTDQCIAQIECAWNTVHKCNHVHRETGLQLGELEQVVHDHVGVRIALQRDNEIGLTTR